MRGEQVLRTLSGRFYGTGHRDFAFTFKALGMVGGGGGTLATEAPPEWAEERRFRHAVAGLLTDGGFDNARDNSDTWIAPGSVRLASGSAVDFSDWSCGFRGNVNVLSCALSGSQVRLVADLRGARAGVSAVPLRGVGGIQLADVRGRRAPYRKVRRYGGWMEQAGFHLYTGVPAQSTDANTQLQAGQTFTIADAFGVASGSAPDMTATYVGAMVGTPTTGADAGDVLVGDAELVFDANRNRVALDFTNIINLDNNGMRHTPGAISFAILSLIYARASQSILPQVLVQCGGATLSARFYGDTHQEVAGTFNHMNVVGSFGAQRVSAGFPELRRFERAVADLLGDGDDATLINRRLLWLDPTETTVNGVNHGFFAESSYCGFGTGADSFTCSVNNNLSSEFTLAANLAGGTLAEDLREVRGLQLTDVSAADGSNVRRYGGWMEHAGFHLYTGLEGRLILESEVFTIADSFGFGRMLSPFGNATWQGAMVGTPVSGPDKGDVLVGDARLDLVAEGRGITAHFTKILNVDDNLEHSDIRVAGVFRGFGFRTLGGAVLGGQIYGPNWAEIAGHFNAGGVIGAFGAKRLPTAAEREVARAVAAIDALIADSEFDNDRPPAVLAPDNLRLANGSEMSFTLRNCGFGANAYVFDCDLQDNNNAAYALTADLSANGGIPFADPVRQTNDVFVTLQRGTGDNRSALRYGAWMDHAGFYLYRRVPIDSMGQGAELDSRTYIIGDFFGSDAADAPSANTIFKGAMVGTLTDRNDPNYGDRVLAGDADMTYRISDGGVRINFSNIVRLSLRGPDDTPSTLSLDSLDLRIRLGRLVSDASPGAVDGGFYGPEGSEEFVGRFESGAIHGVFGVKRHAAVEEPRRVEVAVARHITDTSILVDRDSFHARIAPGEAQTQEGPEVATVTFEDWSCNFEGPVGSGAKLRAPI